MSYKRNKNFFNPNNTKPFRLSRSKIDLFLECPRCFYLDRRLGFPRLSGFPFTLNIAVDTLLKKEFDNYRVNGKYHPLIEKYGIDARPALHDELKKWRHNFTGVQYLHEPTNLLIFGAIDDLWQNSKGQYLVVDYKATAKSERITELNNGWHIAYKRQMEVYQWLLRRNGLDVSDTGFFVYCNGQMDRETFDGKLEFDLTLIPYTGSDEWVENSIKDIYDCLLSEHIPDADENCDYCAYHNSINMLPLEQ
jgi:hypothetical protein